MDIFSPILEHVCPLFVQIAQMGLFLLRFLSPTPVLYSPQSQFFHFLAAYFVVYTYFYLHLRKRAFAATARDTRAGARGSCKSSLRCQDKGARDSDYAGGTAGSGHQSGRSYAAWSPGPRRRSEVSRWSETRRRHGLSSLQLKRRGHGPRSQPGVSRYAGQRTTQTLGQRREQAGAAGPDAAQGTSRRAASRRSPVARLED